MSPRSLRILSALSAIVGVLMLGASFATNPGPPVNATGAQLIAFGDQYGAGVLWGAWLQAVGPLLIVLFALAIVVLSGATRRLAGWMTLFGCATLMTVSLIEITFYMSALNRTPIGNDAAGMAEISIALIHSVQHLYFIAGAPALFIPLGAVILGSSLLPRVFGFLAIALGAAFFIAGIVFHPDLTLPVPVQAAASVQTLWWVAAAITLIVRPGEAEREQDARSAAR